MIPPAVARVATYDPENLQLSEWCFEWTDRIE